MKYCPYCGAELISESVAFCSECGKPLEKTAKESAAKNPKKKPFIKKRLKKEQKTEKKPAKEPIEETIVQDEPDNAVQTPPVDDYDGYYDDVIPFMEDDERQTLDKDMIKKISILVGVMLTVIILCVILLYKL